MFQNLKRPKFWEKRGPLAWLLWPLSWLYEKTVALWMRAQRARPLPVPGLCIGNATVGGEGKTPLVMALGEAAQEQGLRVHVVLKPHQVSLKGPMQVDPKVHRALQVGDEALMIAKRGLVTWVGPKRYETALACAQAGAELLIFDDGFQDPTLGGVQKFLLRGALRDNGFMLPAGPGRENLKAAAHRAAGYVVEEGGGDVSGLPPRPIFTVQRHLHIPEAVRHKPLVAFCALGNPHQFKEGLLAAGLHLVDFVIFPDHHLYTTADLQRLARLASEKKALLVTTEKDQVKIPLNFCLQVQIIPLKITLNNIQALLKAVIPG